MSVMDKKSEEEFNNWLESIEFVDEDGYIFSDAEDCGWIEKDKMLLWSNCLITEECNLNRKAMILNTIDAFKERIEDVEFARFYYDPQLRIASDLKSSVYKIYFVYKNSPNSILLGRKSSFSFSGSKESIVGWVRKSRITPWDHRLAIEPNWTSQSVSERKSNEIKLRFFDSEEVASQYNSSGTFPISNRLWEENPYYEERKIGEYPRFPVLYDDGDNLVKVGIIDKMTSKYGTINLDSASVIAEHIGDWRNATKNINIVFVIDELADLMVANAKEIEGAIIRLAQMARAVGIHLILATQRPSVDVITGLIKANMPARIAFSVASGTDSRTILDMLGAEKLLGRGDMLFKNAEMSKPVRLQGAFLSDDEIDKIVKYVKRKAGKPEYINEIIERQVVKGMGGVGLDGRKGDEDELLLEAKEIVVNMGKASASFLQRKLRIGYARAASILDQLEELGIIGPSNGSKPREVLISKEQMESMDNMGPSGMPIHNRDESEAPENYLGEESGSATVFKDSDDKNEEDEEDEEEDEEDEESSDAEAMEDRDEDEDEEDEDHDEDEEENEDEDDDKKDDEEDGNEDDEDDDDSEDEDEGKYFSK